MGMMVVRVEQGRVVGRLRRRTPRTRLGTMSASRQISCVTYSLYSGTTPSYPSHSSSSSSSEPPSGSSCPPSTASSSDQFITALQGETSSESEYTTVPRAPFSVSSYATLPPIPSESEYRTMPEEMGDIPSEPGAPRPASSVFLSEEDEKSSLSRVPSLETSDTIDNVKVKIQDEEASPSTSRFDLRREAA
ncbi:hypothetical protein B0H12DRAFT_297404 [Mycena haematopus]|nr:hypothetical protein B0H12DRAFT_297404 [Mycena haematopus]